MRSSRLPIFALLSLALLAAPAPSVAAPTAPDRGTAAASTTMQAAATKQAASKRKTAARRPKPKATRKTCRHGYVLRTVKVKRKGKTVRVARCRKRRPAKPAPVTPPTQPVPIPLPPPFGPPPAPEDPALVFVQDKLANSRFTSCPAGGCTVTESFSHSGGTFYHCRVTKFPGPGNIGFRGSYSIHNPRVESSRAWSFDSEAPGYGKYQWSVAADGTVKGVFYKSGESRGTELPPNLVYVAQAIACGS